MNILVTASEPSDQSPVDSRFGRAAYFIVFDAESGAFTAHENTQNLNAVQGAGIQAAQNAVERGAGVVITGHCGPKAFKVLEASQVKVVLAASGTAREMFDLYKAGKLTPVNSPDVEGHWA